jgi:GT2 family glycosyltransferase
MSIGTVTVLIPAYNAMPHLRPALESILHQTFRELEILVIDDGSTDGTAAYLASIADPRLRVLQQANQGVVATLNRGLREARHDWVARMDADDIAVPERIAKQAAFAEAHPEYCCIGAFMAYVGRNNQPYVRQWPGRKQMRIEKVRMAHPPDVDPMVAAIPHPTAFYARQRVLQVGGYREQTFPAEDLDLWLRLAEVGRMACLPEPLLLYRLSPGGVSANSLCRQFLAKRYVLTCAEARRAGRAEPTLEAYRLAQPLTFNERRLARAVRCLRSSRALVLQGRWFQACGYYLAFGALHPRGLASSLLNQFFRSDR